ncbi:uncharacterized protein LOC142332547 [Lycorma delicatula]|uniref:uncharacterized protein LOC142332547 n=1 Tax=Lycorma delicatula TaxID=130591 RepID=UPI003F516BB9
MNSLSGSGNINNNFLDARFNNIPADELVYDGQDPDSLSTFGIIRSTIDESYGDILNSDPMLNSCNDFKRKNKTEDMSAWKGIHITEWTSSDVLYWISEEARNNNIFLFDSYLPNFCELEGGDLMNLTIEDFMGRTPKDRAFAQKLYMALQRIKNGQNISKHSDRRPETDSNENDLHLLTSIQSFTINDREDRNHDKNNREGYDLMNVGYTGDDIVLSPYDLCMDIRPDRDSGVDSCSDSEQSFGGEHNYKSLEDLCSMQNDDKSGREHLNLDFSNRTTKLEFRNIGETDDRRSDSSIEEQNVKIEEELSNPPAKKRPGRPKGIRKKKPEKVGRLWEFLRDLLQNPEYNPSIICWDDYDIGTFRFVRSDKVAALWGSKKDNPRMTFDKFSRAMRYYYKPKIFTAVHKRLIYQFGENATKWRTSNPILR